MQLNPRPDLPASELTPKQRRRELAAILADGLCSQAANERPTHG